MSDPTSLPNFPPPADEHPLRGRVLDVLKDLGLNPNIDGDGDVAFMIGEPPQQLFVRCLDGDWPVMRIFGQWLIGEQVPDDLYLRLQRCNDFSLQLNLAKVGIANNNLVVSVEHVVTMQTDISALFQISVNLIMEVVQMWHASFQTPPRSTALPTWFFSSSMPSSSSSQCTVAWAGDETMTTLTSRRAHRGLPERRLRLGLDERGQLQPSCTRASQPATAAPSRRRPSSVRHDRGHSRAADRLRQAQSRLRSTRLRAASSPPGCQPQAAKDQASSDRQRGQRLTQVPASAGYAWPRCAAQRAVHVCRTHTDTDTSGRTTLRISIRAGLPHWQGRLRRRPPPPGAGSAVLCREVRPPLTTEASSAA